MPEAVSGGATADVRKTETDTFESTGLELIAPASQDHRATIREVLASARTAFHVPARTTAIPQTPSNAVAPLMASFTAWGSSRRNEGTANSNVAPAARMNGAILRTKRKSALCGPESRWRRRQRIRHTPQTTSERAL